MMKMRCVRVCVYVCVCACVRARVVPLGGVYVHILRLQHANCWIAQKRNYDKVSNCDHTPQHKISFRNQNIMHFFWLTGRLPPFRNILCVKNVCAFFLPEFPRAAAVRTSKPNNKRMKGEEGKGRRSKTPSRGGSSREVLLPPCFLAPLLLVLSEHLGAFQNAWGKMPLNTRIQ